MISWIEQRRRAARRRRLGRILLAALGLTATVALFGLLLPAEQRIRVRGALGRPPDAVWRVLTDLDGLVQWRSDLILTERLPEVFGRVTWRERRRDGDWVFELVVMDPPHRLVAHRLLGGQPVLPERTIDLVESPGGTTITLTERVRVGNPLRRVLVRLGAGSGGPRILLRDLERRFNVRRQEVAAEQTGAR